MTSQNNPTKWPHKIASQNDLTKRPWKMTSQNDLKKWPQKMTVEWNRMVFECWRNWPRWKHKRLLLQVVRQPLVESVTGLMALCRRLGFCVSRGCNRLKCWLSDVLWDDFYYIGWPYTCKYNPWLLWACIPTLQKGLWCLMHGAPLQNKTTIRSMFRRSLVSYKNVLCT